MGRGLGGTWWGGEGMEGEGGGRGGWICKERGGVERGVNGRGRKGRRGEEKGGVGMERAG